MKDYTQSPDAGADGIIEGRNAVAEALRSGTPIDKLYIARGETDRTLARIAAQAKKAGVVVVEADRRKLDAMSATGSHQGVIASAAVRAYASVEDIFRAAGERGETPLVVVCDELSDPHNLGAVIRTAECAGAHGVIIPKRRSAGLTAVVAKTSAGAVSYLPVARVANIPALLKELKERAPLRGGPQGPRRHRHRKRGGRHGPSGPGELRRAGEHPHERAHLLPQRLGRRRGIAL